MNNKTFWKAALIRAVRTMAQSALALIPVAATTLYPTVTIVLMYTAGNIIKNERITTAYEA